MFNLNLSNVNSRDPLPEGLYTFTVMKCEETLSKNGKSMIKVQLLEPDTKTTVFDNIVIQENTLWKVKQFLSALGVETDGDVTFDASELEGSVVQARVIQQDYEGSPQNRIAKYL